MGRPRRSTGQRAAGTTSTVRVAAYLRVSTQEQAEEGYGLAAQEQAIRQHCAAQGWELAEVYTDPGVSGTKRERPALARLLTDAAHGRFSRVVILKLDRLARDTRLLLDLYDQLDAAHVQVVSVREAIDTSTACGRLFRDILAALATFERENINDRCQSGRVEAARRGKSLGGYVALGLVRDGDGWQIDADKAAIVRRIFEARAAGQTYQQIADALDAEQIATTRGGRWRPSTVQAIVTNPAYKGTPAWSKRGTPVQAEAATVPAIVSERVWEQANVGRDG